MSVLSLLPEDKRKDLSARKESVASVYSSNSRLNLLSKRKRMVPAGAGGTMGGAPGDRFVTQRVLSAKTHRVKQLQNQLADAHYHLQELSNENRVLRAMQKKQEIALQRYENSNAELPQVLNSHTEEMRVQQARYKQLRAQHKETAARLKERDAQLQQLRDEHQHLLDLTKDKNLLEREKLQAQVNELSLKVQQQGETISLLQRRLALEAKNFRHQLQSELNKHKDTRHDLDMAISNADKLSTIIEMKEKMLSTAASRGVKSPVKSSSSMTLTRPQSKTNKAGQESSSYRPNDERHNVDQSALGKLCENSRSVSSTLSHDDETSSSTEPRSRYIQSRSNSTGPRSTPNPTRKNSKSPEDIIEISKTIQDGMADLAISDDDTLRNCSPEEMQQRMEILKADLLKKIKTNEEPISRRNSALRRKSTEESIEEQIELEEERPKSRGRKNSNVSFYDNVTIEESTSIVVHDFASGDASKKTKRETSGKDKKPLAKPIETYCKDIMQDLEKSSKVIDSHIKQFNSTKMESDKLVEQLFAVDKINDLVNSDRELPEETLSELNNNFKLLTDQVLSEGAPVARKRSLGGRRNARLESKTNLLGDSNMSNQELLDDLLGKK
ncbi:PREDICTED: lebercilin [Papilio polytes]|uniref:lebercilin n=1 Tax=Papilio polytes TaxID=76194 RepID=UPI0006760745|nr:PREDICTED: lebercilin [Papilio polytes]